MTTLYDLMGDCNVRAWISPDNPERESIINFCDYKRGKRAYLEGEPYTPMEKAHWRKGWRRAQRKAEQDA